MKPLYKGMSKPNRPNRTVRRQLMQELEKRVHPVEGLQGAEPGFALNLQKMSPKLLDFSGIGGDDKEVPCIMKVQRPLSGDTSKCLAYNKTRSISYFMPFDAVMQKVFKDNGNPAKIFVKAHLIPDPNNAGAHKFRMIEMVRPQPW